MLISTIPYIADLVDIRSFMELQDSSFPNNWCHRTANLVSRIIGLQQVAGDYVVHESFSINHGWNYDPERNLYIDLTQDQFAQTKDKIIMQKPEDSKLVYRPLNTFLERFLNLEDLFTGESFELYKKFVKERNTIAVTVLT